MKPDPGTIEALRQGCMCPPTNYQPVKTKTGVNNFEEDWMCVRRTCPLHGWVKETSNG